MITQPLKVFQGVASRHQMFHLFDRHAQAPMSKARYTGRLYDGEWFEIGRAEHDYMFEILPPLWMRGDAFAMREFMAGAITSVFSTLSMTRPTELSLIGVPLRWVSTNDWYSAALSNWSLLWMT